MTELLWLLLGMPNMRPAVARFMLKLLRPTFPQIRAPENAATETVTFSLPNKVTGPPVYEFECRVQALLEVAQRAIVRTDFDVKTWFLDDEIGACPALRAAAHDLTHARPSQQYVRTSDGLARYVQTGSLSGTGGFYWLVKLAEQLPPDSQQAERDVQNAKAVSNAAGASQTAAGTTEKIVLFAWAREMAYRRRSPSTDDTHWARSYERNSSKDDQIGEAIAL